MLDILNGNYGWFFAVAVVTISTGALLYGITVVMDTWVQLRTIRATGQNGILEGLTLVSLKAHIIRLFQLALFNAAGWIVLGVVIAGSPPEGILLSFSRSLTLANVSLTAWALVWGQAARRHLAAKEAERKKGETT